MSKIFFQWRLNQKLPYIIVYEDEGYVWSLTREIIDIAFYNSETPHCLHLCGFAWETIVTAAQR